MTALQMLRCSATRYVLYDQAIGLQQHFPDPKADPNMTLNVTLRTIANTITNTMSTTTSHGQPLEARRALPQPRSSET